MEFFFQVDEDHYKKHNQSKCRIVVPSPNEHSYKILLHLKPTEHCGWWGRKILGVFWENTSHSNIRSNTHKVSATWLPKNVLNMDDTRRYTKVDGEKTTRPKPYRETKSNQKFLSGRNSYTKGKIYQLVIPVLHGQLCKHK